MKAVTFDHYGDANVLAVTDVPEPHAGPGQVRIKVRAASVNAIDWKIRAGYLAQMMPVEFPAVIGRDAAGVIDEVGDGVTGFEIGDEVLGLGNATTAEYAVLDHFGIKPAPMSFESAAGLPLVTETAERTLNMLAVKSGDTLVIEGAAGGTGSASVQLAIARGAKVIGTASERNHDYLRGLGVIPTTYGPGIADRLKDLGVEHVDAVLDNAGAGTIAELVTLVDDPAQVVTIADFEAGKHGARISDGSTDAAFPVLNRIVELSESGFDIPVEKAFGLENAAAAHELSQGGHVRGKVVVTVGSTA